MQADPKFWSLIHPKVLSITIQCQWLRKWLFGAALRLEDGNILDVGAAMYCNERAGSHQSFYITSIGCGDDLSPLHGHLSAVVEGHAARPPLTLSGVQTCKLRGREGCPSALGSLSSCLTLAEVLWAGRNAPFWVAT